MNMSTPLILLLTVLRLNGIAYEQVLLLNRLQNAVKRINPDIPADAQAGAIKEIQRIASSEPLANNEAFHRLLTEGIPVSKRVDWDDQNPNGIFGSAPEFLDFNVLFQPLEEQLYLPAIFL